MTRCGTCGEKMYRKLTEKAWNFKRRKFCGRECQHRGMLALKPAQVTQARKMILAGVSALKIAKALGVGPTLVNNLVMNKTYQHIPWP